MNARWLSNAGNSLTEVMVGVVIVTLVATATTKGIVYTTGVVGENTMQQQAIVLAQQAVERFRTSSYDSITSSTTTSSNGQFSIVRTVAENTPEQGMKQITIQVQWTWKGQSRSYELATIFAKLTKS